VIHVTSWKSIHPSESITFTITWFKPNKAVGTST
jgi:hypothetical protein